MEKNGVFSVVENGNPRAQTLIRMVLSALPEDDVCGITAVYVEKAGDEACYGCDYVLSGNGFFLPPGSGNANVSALYYRRGNCGAGVVSIAASGLCARNILHEVGHHVYFNVLKPPLMGMMMLKMAYILAIRRYGSPLVPYHLTMVKEFFAESYSELVGADYLKPEKQRIQELHDPIKFDWILRSWRKKVREFLEYEPEWVKKAKGRS